MSLFGGCVRQRWNSSLLVLHLCKLPWLISADHHHHVRWAAHRNHDLVVVLELQEGLALHIAGLHE